MRYFKFKLIYKEPTGEKDKLGNEIRRSVESQPFRARFGEWTKEEIELFGREVTDNSFKILSYQLSQEQASRAEYVVCGSERLKVEEVKYIGRWVLLVVRGKRNGLSV